MKQAIYREWMFRIRTLLHMRIRESSHQQRHALNGLCRITLGDAVCQFDDSEEDVSDFFNE